MILATSARLMLDIALFLVIRDIFTHRKSSMAFTNINLQEPQIQIAFVKFNSTTDAHYVHPTWPPIFSSGKFRQENLKVRHRCATLDFKFKTRAISEMRMRHGCVVCG